MWVWVCKAVLDTTVEFHPHDLLPFNASLTFSFIRHEYIHVLITTHTRTHHHSHTHHHTHTLITTHMHSHHSHTHHHTRTHRHTHALITTHTRTHLHSHMHSSPLTHALITTHVYKCAVISSSSVHGILHHGCGVAGMSIRI